jgi:chloramphenicol O-acetyltransferase type A
MVHSNKTLTSNSDFRGEIMNYKHIDMASYNRLSHFEYFKSLAQPYVGVTVNVNITKLIATIRENKFPFFLTICYCVSQAANGVSEFKQRIVEDKIIEFNNCQTSHTVSLDDGTYTYCNLDFTPDFAAFLSYAVEEQEKAKTIRSIDEEVEGTLNKLFISTLPWFSFTSMINPTPVPADSNPRITWGKYFEQNKELLLPLSVLANHALVDGAHIAAFYTLLDEEIEKLVQNYQ